MAEAGPPPPTTPASPWATVLIAAGLVYIGLGVLIGAAYVFGGVHSSLFPTGWLFPLVLLLSGALMTTRRRFDITMTLWGGLTLAVFMLGVLAYVDALGLGVDDAAAFDASIIVAAFGLLPLLLRRSFAS
jgi:hypothetical protein